MLDLKALYTLASLPNVLTFLKGLRVKRFARFTSFDPVERVNDIVGALYGTTFPNQTWVHGTQARGYAYASEEVERWAQAKGLSPEVLVALIALNDHDPDGSGGETQGERYTRVVATLEGIVKGGGL